MSAGMGGGPAIARPFMESTSVKRYLPWVVATALFMEQLDSTIVNTAVPAMAASLHVTPLSLKAVVTSYILSLAVCIPISGWMADRFGTRRVFASAVALFTLSSMLCGVSVNVPMLVAARILQGISGAMMMPVGRLAVIRTFPKSELLRATVVLDPAAARWREREPRRLGQRLMRLADQPRRSTRPGRAPLGCPPRQTTTPLTATV